MTDPRDEIPAPNFKEEFCARVAEHELFLSFNSDWQAAAFADWFADEGLRAFRRWAASNKSEYQW